MKILEFQTIEHPYSCQARVIDCESWEKYKELLKDGKVGVPSYAHFAKDFEREESGLKHIHGYYINIGLNNALVHHNAFCWE